MPTFQQPSDRPTMFQTLYLQIINWCGCGCEAASSTRNQYISNCIGDVQMHLAFVIAAAQPQKINKSEEINFNNFGGSFCTLTTQEGA